MNDNNDSVGGTATRCGLEGSTGILCTLSDLTWSPPNLLYSRFRVVALTTYLPSSAEVKERVEQVELKIQ